MARAKKVRTPTHVNAFVVSFRLPPDTTLGQVRTATLAVKKHLGALCAELGGPDVSTRTDLSISSPKGLFLIGTPPPGGVAVTWPKMDEPSFEGVIKSVPQGGPGMLKLVAEESARSRSAGVRAKPKRAREKKGRPLR